MPQRFFDALHARDFELFDALMVEMPRVDLARLRTDEGATLLHVAASRGQVEELLLAGANVHAMAQASPSPPGSPSHGQPPH